MNGRTEGKVVVIGTGSLHQYRHIHDQMSVFTIVFLCC